MGFLDHSTNNIILDAVLTDKGREFLSRNDGSFNIVKFAFGDDEIDYTVIEKFGRTIGKEKIEKNTPIFEGLTNGQYALKYKLVSISRPNLSKMPTMELAARTSTSSTLVSLDLVTSRNDTVTINQTIANNETIPIELVDQVYQVKLNNSIVALSDGSKPINIDQDGTATYLVRRNSALGTSGGSGINLKISLKSTLTTSSFTNLSNATDKDLINTVAEIKGLQSGKAYTLPIEVRKS
jgi:hypothetical protein